MTGILYELGSKDTEVAYSCRRDSVPWHLLGQIPAVDQDLGTEHDFSGLVEIFFCEMVAS